MTLVLLGEVRKSGISLSNMSPNYRKLREGVNMDFFQNNYQWIFSGIGVFVIGLFLTRGIMKRKNLNQMIKNQSMGIQAGRDVKIGVNKDDESKSG